MVRKLSFISVAAGLAAVSLLAQGPGRHMGSGPGDFAFVRAEFGVSNKVVQGAPYSATITNESVQTLADGNRIVQSSTGTTARDSMGRRARLARETTRGLEG